MGLSSGRRAVLCYILCSVAMWLPVSSSGCKFTLAADSGVVMSDSDGRGPDLYDNSLNCSHKVDCAAGDDIAFTVYGETEKGFDTLSFSWVARNGTTIAPVALSGILQHSFVVAASSALIIFRTDGSVKKSGFTLTYRCAKCNAAPNTRAVDCAISLANESRGTVMSDADGSGWKVLSDDAQYMRWDIACPASVAYTGIEIAVAGMTAPRDALLIERFRIPSSNGGAEVALEVPLTGTMNSLTLATPSTSAALLYATASGYPHQSGFTASYRCLGLDVAAGVLTSPSGIIMSDADGASADTYYTAGSLAQWLVSCPGATSRIELNATSFLGVGDVLVVVPFRDDRLNTSFLTSFSGYQCSDATVAARKALLQLQGSSGGPGFTLHYTCVGDYPRPAAPGTPVCGSTLTKPNGTVMSDPDGSGSSYYTAASSSFAWTVECARAYNAIEFFADVSLSNATVLITWNGYEGFVRLTGTVSRSFVVNSGHVVVSLSTTSSCRGMSLNYQCKKSSTSSTLTRLTASSGIIMSDADGASADTYYAAVSLAQWVVSCPEATSRIELNATSFLGVGDELIVVPIRDEQLYFGGLTSFSGYQCSDATVAARKALLQLQGSSGGPGFTVHYTCVGDYSRPPAPGTPVCGSTLTKPNGTVMSDPDGSGSGAYLRGMNVTWVVACSDVRGAIRVVAKGTLSQPDYVAVGWGSSERDALCAAGLSAVTLNGTFSLVFFADGRYASINFRTSSASLISGFTISYRCMGGLPPPALLTVRSGSILSDADGAGPNYLVPAGAASQWRVVCPLPTLRIVFDVVAFLGVESILSIMPVDGSGWMSATGAWSTSSFECARAYINGSAALVQLASDVEAIGFSATYECLQSVVYSGSTPPCGYTLRSLTGTLLSDPDGMGPLLYANNQLFSWTIECPRNQSNVRVVVIGATESCCDILTIRYGSVGRLQLSGNVSYLAVLLGPVLNVSFKTDSSVVARGLCLTYACTSAAPLPSSTSTPHAASRNFLWLVYFFPGVAVVAVVLWVAGVSFFACFGRRFVAPTRLPACTAHRPGASAPRGRNRNTVFDASIGVVVGMEPLCVRCLCKRPSRLLLPCGHFAMCDECATRWRALQSTCPLCATAIAQCIAYTPRASKRPSAL